MYIKIRYIFKVIRERGIGFFWTYFRESVWFDLRHGTSTSTRVPKDEQTIESSDKEANNGLLYVASFTSVTRDTVSYVRSILSSDKFANAQFVDLGCGKGKALLVFVKLFGASRELPALGIEYDTNLAELARQNVVKCGFAKDRIKVITDSAVNVLNHTQSDMLIVYLYNSFQGETLRLVLDALANTPHVLIYVDPAEESALAGYDYNIIQRNKGSYNADTWLVASSRV